MNVELDITLGDVDINITDHSPNTEKKIEEMATRTAIFVRKLNEEFLKDARPKKRPIKS